MNRQDYFRTGYSPAASNTSKPCKASKHIKTWCPIVERGVTVGYFGPEVPDSNLARANCLLPWARKLIGTTGWPIPLGMLVRPNLTTLRPQSRMKSANQSIQLWKQLPCVRTSYTWYANCRSNSSRLYRRSVSRAKKAKKLGDECPVYFPTSWHSGTRSIAVAPNVFLFPVIASLYA